MNDKLLNLSGARPPKGIENQYAKELSAIVRSVAYDVVKHVFPILKVRKTNDWILETEKAFDFLKLKWSSSEFQQKARELARVNTIRINEYNKRTMISNKGVIVGDSEKAPIINIFSSKEMQNTLLSSSYANAQLIESIPTQYLDKVQSSVIQNMRAGGLIKDLVKDLKANYNTTQSRAELIAVDQTLKTNADVSQQRMQDLGVTLFKWQTVGDSRVRSRHKSIADKKTKYGIGIYSFSDLPLSDKGERIAPGKDYRCRCYAKPIFKSKQGEIF